MRWFTFPGAEQLMLATLKRRRSWQKARPSQRKGNERHMQIQILQAGVSLTTTRGSKLTTAVGAVYEVTDRAGRELVEQGLAVEVFAPSGCLVVRDMDGLYSTRGL